MAKSDMFRRQHQELLELVKQMEAMLQVSTLPTKAKEVRTLLSTLIGKLNVHLAMEDQSLYPSLKAAPDEKLRNLGRRFVDEMGGIKSAVEAFSKTYGGATAIAAAPDAFVKGINDLFAVLRKRIKREDDELYPALDRLG